MYCVRLLLGPSCLSWGGCRRGAVETLQKPMKNCLGAPKRDKIQRKITWVSQNGMMKNHLGENVYVFCWGQVVFPGAVAGVVPPRCGRMETLQKPMKNCLGAPKRYKNQ